jgi:hypothetical protein
MIIIKFIAPVVAILRSSLLVWRLLIAAKVTNLIARVVVAEALDLVGDRRLPGPLRLRALLLLPPWRRWPAIARRRQASARQILVTEPAHRHGTAVGPREIVVSLLVALLLALSLADIAHAAARGAPSLAHASGAGVPTYNIEAACRALAAVPEVRIFETSGPNSTQHCVESENQAREQLLQQWSQFKAADRAMCVGASNQGEVDPVYTELISCLEMARDNHGSEPSTTRAQSAIDDARSLLR